MLGIIDLAFQAYFWVIIMSVVMSWLIAFNIANPYNPAVRSIQRFCYVLTEPLLGPIRRALPDLGGLDLSPIVLLLGMEVVHILIVRTLTGTLL